MTARHLITALLTLLSGSCLATTYRVSHTLNDDFWIFGSSSHTHQLSGPKDNEFDGTSFQISIGKGTVRDAWNLFTTIDIISGPFKPFFDGQLEIEFEGLGLSSYWHHTISGQTIRGQVPSINFALGINLNRINGSSIGQNNSLKSNYNAPENNGKINKYDLTLSTLNLMIGPTLSWVESARPRGNEPSLLKTRIEGYNVSLLFQIPLYASYSSETKKLSYNDSTRQITGQDSSESGSMSGWSFVVSLSTYISG